MSCGDCGGSTLPLWTRCYECALRFARRLMSPFPLNEPAPARKYSRGDAVLVSVSEESFRLGRVVRRQGATYVVELEGAAEERWYGTAEKLREAPP